MGKAEGEITGEMSNPKDVFKKHMKTMNLTRDTYSGDHVYLRDTGCQTESPVLRCGTPALTFVVGDTLEIPRTAQTVITAALGCITKLHVKASLLKTTAEGTTYTGHMIWRNQVGTDQEACYL